MKRTEKKKKGYNQYPNARNELHVAFPPIGKNPWPKDIAMKSTKKKLVMTNDPSINAWGWAVVDPTNNSIIECGAIKTTPQAVKLRIRKGDDRVRRVSEINFKLIEVIKKHNVSLIISELPHGSKSAVAAVMIGTVTGIMQTLGDSLEIPVEWFSEGDAKMATVGSRSAGKDEMLERICDLFECKPWTGVKWKDEAVADSLAVYYVARQQSPLLKMLGNQ